MLSARGQEVDRVMGLELGADDYVTQPFSPRELVLRVRSVLRRTARGPRAEPAEGPEPLRDGDLELDRRARLVCRRGQEIAVTAREFDLLAFLVAHPGRAFTRRS